MQVVNNVLSDTLYYEDEPVLTYKINYPQFQNNKASNFIERLNAFYKENAEIFQNYIRDTLYSEAVDQYIYAKSNGFPNRPYDVVMDYNVTYLTNDIISLYFDKYIYSGGAHGNTVRSADTWNLNSRRLLELSDFFPQNPNYKEDIVNFIIQEISTQRQAPGAEDIYFGTYEQDVHNTWNEDNFYVTPAGIMIFFQQYDIAPYSSGIIQFLIPFSSQSVS